MSDNFQTKWTTLTFLAQICPKIDFGVEISKNLSADSESAPPLYNVCSFSVKINNFEFFHLNLGKLSNYMWHFGSSNVKSVGKNWVEAEMNWVEVEIRWVQVDRGGWSWVYDLVISLKNSLITHQGLLYGKKQFCSGGNL